MIQFMTAMRTGVGVEVIAESHATVRTFEFAHSVSLAFCCSWLSLCHSSRAALAIPAGLLIELRRICSFSVLFPPWPSDHQAFYGERGLSPLASPKGLITPGKSPCVSAQAMPESPVQLWGVHPSDHLAEPCGREIGTCSSASCSHVRFIDFTPRVL